MSFEDFLFDQRDRLGQTPAGNQSSQNWWAVGDLGCSSDLDARKT
jgi:hypothetical protein